MQTQIQCTNCGIELTVEQSTASAVYACPSCGTHFQIAAPQAVQVGTAAIPEPVAKKPSLLLNTSPMPQQRPSPARHNMPSPYPTTLAPKSTDKTVLLLVCSVVLLCIVCITLVFINSSKSNTPQIAQTVAKPTQTDIRKGIEEKAQEFLESSAPTIQRDIEKAQEEQKEYEEERDRQRIALAPVYGEKFFDGDRDAGYELIVEMENVLDMFPESQKQAQQYLLERMKKNPVLKPHIAKIDELPFSDKHSKGPMSFLSEYKSFGSGFFITSDGWIVSNRHVVGDAKEVDIRISDGTTHRAKVVKTDDTFDLALLKVEAKAPKCLPVSKGNIDLGLGRSVFTIGFPNPVLQGIEPKYTDGKVSATAGMEDDKSFYQISVPVQPGNSGGALVDAETGWVVGVVTLRLDSTSDGRSVQNVSYAIKSSALHKFVEKVSESESEDISIVSNKISSAEGFIELAKNSAVQILVPRDKDDPSEE
jgi:S1-C subfamily serine protease